MVHIFLFLCMPSNFYWILDNVKFMMLCGMYVMLLWRVFAIVLALTEVIRISLIFWRLALRLCRRGTEHSVHKAKSYGVVLFWRLHWCAVCIRHVWHQGFPLPLVEVQSPLSLVLSLWMASLHCFWQCSSWLWVVSSAHIQTPSQRLRWTSL